jgi:hypothetical protein
VARDRIAEQGAEVVGNTPAEFRAFLNEETDGLRPSSAMRRCSSIEETLSWSIKS